MGKIPDDAPSWLAWWIGHREGVQERTDERLDTIEERTEKLEEGQVHLTRKVDALPSISDIERIFNGRRKNHSGPASKAEPEKGVVTWQELARSLLIPVILGINTIILGLVLSHVIGGG